MADQVTSPPSGPTAAPAGAPAPPEPGVPFTLDGRPATARPGEVLISAAERAGTYIPRFCYHPRMKPVGMCRMCLVEVSGPRGATLQPACFIAVTEGMEVGTTSDKVKKAQDGVLELLLVNHPLDCPICDKGGECPLQDQTLAYGPGESRFVEEKRHFEKPVAISELVLLDRERCIQCARCTRFAEEVAGEAQIDFAGRGERVEVATFPGEPFTSYFSGNTVQICPVGALTATPYRFTARPWDLDQVESTCTTCALGCRVAVQSSANRLTRLLGIDADPVNQGWLCDKGRFVLESVNGDGGRLTEPMVRKDGELVAASWGEALAAAADGLAAARDAGGSGAVALIGGARLTNEGAYAWAKVAKGVLGTDSVDAQLGDGLPAELVLSLPPATIDEACAADTVVLLAGDLREEVPVLFLRLRHAAVEGGTSLVELTPSTTSLTRHAAVSLPARPGDAPALARALTGDDGAAASLQAHPEGPAWSAEALARARALLGPDAGRVV
ncbi:MAG: 2Fe-2S iron-sulfur cluster-binding protein, partial [Acidimicrobiales bacterium]